MKTISTLAIAATALTGSSLALAQDLSAVPSGSYQLDPTHAYIVFSYSHFGFSNPSLSFDDFTVDLNLDSEDPTKSMVNVVIDANSVVTGSEIWKDHLTSDDWMDTSKHPEITFQSTNIEMADGGNLSVTGDLTIMDTTAPVTLDVVINAATEHPFTGKPTIGLTASADTLRSTFGLGKFAPNISDEVAIEINAEMIKAE